MSTGSHNDDEELPRTLKHASTGDKIVGGTSLCLRKNLKNLKNCHTHKELAVVYVLWGNMVLERSEVDESLLELQRRRVLCPVHFELLE